VLIGHINLDKSFNGTGEHFVALVEALDRQGVRQHVIVRNESLAKRLRVYRAVTVGPTTSAPVVAYCLMPQVDVVHAHEERSGQAGLLLTLTRSMPYVLTRRRKAQPRRNPVIRSVYARAARVICATDAGARSLRKFDSLVQVEMINDIARKSAYDFDAACDRIASEHLRVYRHAADTSNAPAILL
jgi:hypothetical protein